VRAIHTLLAVLVLFSSASAQPPATAAIDTLLTEGRYADAEKAARAALASVPDRDSLAAADVLEKLIEARLRQGLTDPETEQLIARTLSIRERLAPGSVGFGNALRHEAWLLEARGNMDAAKARYARALEVLRAAAGADAPETLTAQKDLAMAHRLAGEYATARALLEEALALRARTAPDHIDIAIFRHNLGAVYWELGEYAAAQDAFTAAAAHFEQALGPDHPHVGSALEGLAVIHVALGEYATARSTYLRVLRAREKALGAGHPLIGMTYVNLGDVLMSMGDNDAARRALEKGVAIWERSLGPEHPQLLTGLTNLAVARERLGDRAGARAALTRAIALREKANGPEDPELVVPLTRLANLRAEAGELQAARPLYERAVALAERTRGAEHPYVATALLEQGLHLAAGGDVRAAGIALERAATIRQATLGREHPEVATALDARARVAHARGDAERAMALALEAEVIARRHFQATAAVLSQSQALLYGEGRTRSQDLAVAALVKAGAVDPSRTIAVWDAVVRSRALVLDEMAWRGQLASSAADKDLHALVSTAAGARARLSQLFVRGPAPNRTSAYARELADARRLAEEAEERLAIASAAFRESRRRRAAGLDEVRAALPPDGALVSFLRYDERTFASPQAPPRYAYAVFIISAPSESPRIVRLGSAAAIERAVSAWRRNIRSEMASPPMGARAREQAYRTAAAALRRLVWDPIAPLVAGAPTVMIVPDAVLHLVDFATMPDRRGGFVVEKGPTLHYASAERDLIERAGPSGTGLLALGAPAFDRTATSRSAAVRTTRQSECAVRPGVRFAALPDSGVEAEVVARLWRAHRSEATMLRGAEASEANVKASAPGARALHLATHAFVLGEGCAPGDLGGTTRDVLARNPLLGSGLVLAGASRRTAARRGGEDGILTAEEISALNLAGVEWAVLSACDSGSGTVRAGEGVLGLRRAFQVAGVRTVIMSLWPVDDRQTRQWMESLYTERLVRGATTADAVRAANLGALGARRAAGASTHPAYWAGFVAAGDWR
jgi:CHAT domain-containing protein/Tfp pilus assembly protein PilF